MNRPKVFIEGLGTKAKDVLGKLNQRFPSDGSRTITTYDIDEKSRGQDIKNSQYFHDYTLPIPDEKSFQKQGNDMEPCVPGIGGHSFGLGGGLQSPKGRNAALKAKGYIQTIRSQAVKNLAYDKTNTIGNSLVIVHAWLGGSFGGGAITEFLNDIGIYSAETNILITSPLLRAPDRIQLETNFAAHFISLEKFFSGLRNKTDSKHIIPLILDNSDRSLTFSDNGFIDYSVEHINLFQTTGISDKLSRQFVKNTHAHRYNNPEPHFNGIGWAKITIGRQNLKAKIKHQLRKRVIEEISNKTEKSNSFTLPDPENIINRITGQLTDNVTHELLKRIPMQPQGLVTFTIENELSELLNDLGLENSVEELLYVQLSEFFNEHISSILIREGLQTTRDYAEGLKESMDQLRSCLQNDLDVFVEETRKNLQQKQEAVNKLFTWLPFARYRKKTRFEEWKALAIEFSTLYTTYHIHKTLVEKFIQDDWAEELINELRDWNPENQMSAEPTTSTTTKVGHIQLSETNAANKIIDREVSRIYQSFKDELIRISKDERFYITTLQQNIDHLTESYGFSLANTISTNTIWQQITNEKKEELFSMAMALSAPKINMDPDPELLRGFYILSPKQNQLDQIVADLESYALMAESFADFSKGQHDDDQDAIILFQVVAFPLDKWKNFKEWSALLAEYDSKDDKRWRIAFPTPASALTPRPHELLANPDYWIKPLSDKLSPELVENIHQKIIRQNDPELYYRTIYEWYVRHGSDFQYLLPENEQEKLRERWIILKKEKP